MKRKIMNRCLGLALSVILGFVDNVPILAKENDYSEEKFSIISENEYHHEDSINAIDNFKRDTLDVADRDDSLDEEINSMIENILKEDSSSTDFDKSSVTAEFLEDKSNDNSETECRSEQVEETEDKSEQIEATEDESEQVEEIEDKTEQVEETEDKTEQVEETEDKSEQIEATGDEETTEDNAIGDEQDNLKAESTTTYVRGIIESVDNGMIRMEDGSEYQLASDENGTVDQTLLNSAKYFIGERVVCELIDGLVTKITGALYPSIPVQEGKFTLYAVSKSYSYDYEENVYGTIKNVTFEVNGTKYFPTDGILYLDSDEENYIVCAFAPGFVDSPNYIMQFTDKGKGSITLYPDDGNDEIIYVEGKLKNVDYLEGILLYDNKWYKVANDFSLGSASALINKYVRLSIKYGVVFEMVEIPQPINPNPYGGKNNQNYSKEEIVEKAAKEYNDALNGYFESLAASAQAELKKENKAPKNIGEQLRAIDEAKGSHRLLTLDARMPSDAVNAAYEALAQYLDTYVQEGVDLGKIDLSKNEVQIGAKLINKIRNSMDSLSFSTHTSKGYRVSVQGLGFSGAYWGQMTIQKGSKTYYGNLSSSVDDTAKVMEDYLNQLGNMTKDLYKQALASIVSEFLEVTCISEFTKGALKSFFKDKVKVLQSKGYGDILNYVVQLYDDYQMSKDVINAAGTDNFKDKLKNAKKVYDKLKDRDYSDSSVQNVIVNGAMNRLENAKDKFASALFDYIYDSDTYREKYPNKFASFKNIHVNCPVDFKISDTKGKIIGSYLNGKVYEQSEYVSISVYGDRKTITLKEGIAAEITLIPTDEGTMDYIIEQFLDDEPIGRLCFYDLVLEENADYIQKIGENAVDGSVSQYPLITKDNNTIDANEYISAESEAIVTVSCSIDGGGSVSGTGRYVKSDSVTLIAVPDYGYTFAGWYKDDVYFGNDSTYKCIADNISLEARFEEKRLIPPDYMPKTGKEYDEIIGEHIYISSDNANLADIELRINGVEDTTVLNSIIVNGYLEDELKYSKNITPKVDSYGNLWINGIDVAGCDEIVFSDNENSVLTSLYYVKNYLELESVNITCETTLTEDLYCDKLNLGARIITNGYNIVVVDEITYNYGGKVEINNASYCKVFGNINGNITIYNGKLIAKGNYSSGTVVLNETSAYADVKGSVDLSSTNVEINEGTFCIEELVATNPYPFLVQLY